MKWILLVFTVAIYCIAISNKDTAAQAQAQLTRANNQYEVQQLCDRSHVSDDGELEQACGELQDKYNAEYLCQSFAVDANCWVEMKTSIASVDWQER